MRVHTVAPCVSLQADRTGCPWGIGRQLGVQDSSLPGQPQYPQVCAVHFSRGFVRFIFQELFRTNSSDGRIVDQHAFAAISTENRQSPSVEMIQSILVDGRNGCTCSL